MQNPNKRATTSSMVSSSKGKSVLPACGPVQNGTTSSMSADPTPPPPPRPVSRSIKSCFSATADQEHETTGADEDHEEDDAAVQQGEELTRMVLERVHRQVETFYQQDHADRIQESHGLLHVRAVLQHAVRAIECHRCCAPPIMISSTMAFQIQLAALLHDVDDHKYFPYHKNYENARRLMAEGGVPTDCVELILYMIGLVSCSVHGNDVPERIVANGEHHLLIPRWADRLEAVGVVGVVRCYQYNVEHALQLSSITSPRAVTVDEVWRYATPERFKAYQARGGTSDDMISHYYDKLLHVAQPPPDHVRNEYLEQMAAVTTAPLVEVCLRYGRTGRVDETYLHDLARQLLEKR
jgi:uncharacterized protein